MSLVDFFIARLKAIDPPVFSEIGGALEFSYAIDRPPNAVPAAFVLVEEEASQPSERAIGPVLQQGEADIAVVIVAGNVSDAAGAAAGQDLEGLKAAVRAALIGQVPDAGSGEPIEHTGGNLLKAKGGYAWQRELFACGYYLEEQS